MTPLQDLERRRTEAFERGDAELAWNLQQQIDQRERWSMYPTGA